MTTNVLKKKWIEKMTMLKSNTVNDYKVEEVVP